MNELDEIYGFVKKRIGQLDEETPYSRAMCARLRRAIGKSPADVPDVWEVTLPDFETYAPADGISAAEWAIHTALSLYAMHRQGTNSAVYMEGEGFGKAVASLIKEDENRDAVTRRFNAAATSAEFTELANHARSLIQLLKQVSNKPIDYPRFATELYLFQRGNADRVRLKWGRDFYSYSGQNIKQGTKQDTPNEADETKEGV